MSDALSILINGNEEAGFIHLDSVSLVEAAMGGEVGIGGFNRRDLALGWVPAHKQVLVADTRATPSRMFTGYVGDRTIDRGREDPVEVRREHDVMVLDLNTVLDDEIFSGDQANRPEESDYTRITWLLTTSAISALGITAGVVPNTNTVTMDAVDYRGQGPRRVLDECAEAAAKNYFIYDFGSGPLLYYDKHTGTSLSSSVTMSSVLADVDGSTCFGLEDPRVVFDARHIYSTVRYQYEGGHVWVTDPAIATEFRRRETNIIDAAVKSEAKATAKAEKYLASVSDEYQRFSCAVTLPADQVNDIRAGHRIQIKCPHLGIADFTWFRITRREVAAKGGTGGVSDAEYQLRLEFASDVQILGGGRGIGDGPDGGLDHEHPDPGSTPATVEDSGSPLARVVYEANRWPWNDPTFDFATATIPMVGSRVWPNVAWSLTSCGIGFGGWGPHVWTFEAWFRYDTSALPADCVGLSIDIPPAEADSEPPEWTDGTHGVAVGRTRYVGIGTSEPTGLGQWRLIDELPIAGSNTVFLPRTMLNEAGYTYLVEAPTWKAVEGFMCDDELPSGSQTGDDGASGPGGNGDTSFGSGYYVVDPNASLYAAQPVGITGSGYTPWVGGIGMADGTNATFELVYWDGTGTPEVRVGAIILATGDYTWDSGAKTVTILQAPFEGASVQFRYMAEVP